MFFSSYRSFSSLPLCLSHSFSTLFLVLGATWQAGSVTGCCWHNKPSPRKTYIVPHTFSGREKLKETGRALRVRGGLCSLSIWAGGQDWRDLSEPERLSSPLLLLLLNWALALVLSLSDSHSPWPHIARAFPALETVEPQPDIWNRDLHPPLLRGERCSTPKRSFWAERMQNICSSSRGLSFNCELHKHSNSFLEVPMKESQVFSHSLTDWKCRYLAEAFMISCRFQKILLVNK